MQYEAYETEADISWYTDEYAAVEVRFATSQAALNSGYQSVNESQYKNNHYILLTNLSSSTTYYVRIINTDVHENATSQEISLTTLTIPEVISETVPEEEPITTPDVETSPISSPPQETATNTPVEPEVVQTIPVEQSVPETEEVEEPVKQEVEIAVDSIETTQEASTSGEASSSMEATTSARKMPFMTYLLWGLLVVVLVSSGVVLFIFAQKRLKTRLSNKVKRVNEVVGEKSKPSN